LEKGKMAAAVGSARRPAAAAVAMAVALAFREDKRAEQAASCFRCCALV